MQFRKLIRNCFWNWRCLHSSTSSFMPEIHQMQSSTSYAPHCPESFVCMASGGPVENQNWIHLVSGWSVEEERREGQSVDHRTEIYCSGVPVEVTISSCVVQMHKEGRSKRRWGCGEEWIILVNLFSYLLVSISWDKLEGISFSVSPALRSGVTLGDKTSYVEMRQCRWIKWGFSPCKLESYFPSLGFTI